MVPEEDLPHSPPPITQSDGQIRMTRSKQVIAMHDGDYIDASTWKTYFSHDPDREDHRNDPVVSARTR